MNLRNCPECGRVFVYSTVNMCHACRQKEEEEFIKVKEYLYQNPKIGIFELSEATEVDESKIVRWVREGRIEGKSFPGIVVPCDRCGKPIPNGRYCSQCSNDLARGFSSFTKKEEEPPIRTKAKFHIKE
jgi:flagellar operon protein (TIGR03826 family)